MNWERASEDVYVDQGRNHHGGRRSPPPYEDPVRVPHDNV